MNQRGGDIDILIMSAVLTAKDAIALRVDLWERLGEQKIDLVFVADDSDPFVRLVLPQSVALWFHEALHRAPQLFDSVARTRNYCARYQSDTR